MFRNLVMRWKVRRGKAIDIWSHSEYPTNVLSNLCSNPFRFDGVLCGSMEGFLQSLKQQDKDKQRQICAKKGRNAKHASSTAWPICNTSVARLRLTGSLPRHNGNAWATTGKAAPINTPTATFSDGVRVAGTMEMCITSLGIPTIPMERFMAPEVNMT